MAGRVIADVVDQGGVPVDGIAVTAYKATRFSGIPAMRDAPPSGAPDAGPVVTGPVFGGVGAFEIACPTNEDYYCHAVVVGVDCWNLYPAEGGVTGPAGPTGPSGPAGPTGPAGPDLSYQHDQVTPAATWHVIHNLSRLLPSVAVVDSANSEVEGEVDYLDANSLDIKFAAAFAGKAGIT